MNFAELLLSCFLAVPIAQDSPPIAPSTPAAKESAKQPLEISAEELTALFVDLRSKLSKQADLELPPELKVRLATPHDIELALTEELTRRAKQSNGEDSAARDALKDAARLTSQALMAKYATGTREILLCLTTMNRVLADLPELLTAPPLELIRAILIHESAHAIDHQRFAFDRKLEELETEDAVRAFDAVIEGHAQFVARKACSALGLDRAFEAFNGLVLSKAKAEGFEKFMIEVLHGTIVSSYVQGEAFISALHAKGGDEAIARAFREPPTDPVVISNPDWFLDPSLRPNMIYDFEAAFRALEDTCDENGYQKQRTRGTAVQLKGAFALLADKARVDALCEGLLEFEVLTVTGKTNPADGALILSLVRFRDENVAKSYRVVFRDLDALKCEQMKTGPVRILSGTSETVKVGNDEVDFYEKQVKAGRQQFPVRTAIVARGELAVELVASMREVSRDEWTALAVRIMDAASKEPPKKEPAEKSGNSGH